MEEDKSQHFDFCIFDVYIGVDRAMVAIIDACAHVFASALIAEGFAALRQHNERC